MLLPAANPARRFRPARGACLALLLCLGQTRAAEPDAVFAAFLYNFCLFTTWPDLGLEDAPERPLVIVAAGREIPALRALTERTVRRHAIRVQPLPADGRIPDLCHVLLFADLGAARRDELLALAAQRPILTVAMEPGFCQAGGILEFFVAGERMRFRVDQARMKQAGIRIHSRLLKLAERLPHRKGGG